MSAIRAILPYFIIIFIILTPKYYVCPQTVILDQADDFVDFEKRLTFPTLLLGRIRHARPSVCTTVGHFSLLPEYGTRVCGVWTHSEYHKFTRCT